MHSQSLKPRSRTSRLWYSGSGGVSAARSAISSNCAATAISWMVKNGKITLRDTRSCLVLSNSSISSRTCEFICSSRKAMKLAEIPPCKKNDFPDLDYRGMLSHPLSVFSVGTYEGGSPRPKRRPIRRRLGAGKSQQLGLLSCRLGCARTDLL